jgi:hypothetical protein
MKSSIATKKEITLVLDELEVMWLKNLVQNTLQEWKDDEPYTEKEMRSKFWDALTIGG